jgi:hypothetical protein
MRSTASPAARPGRPARILFSASRRMQHEKLMRPASLATIPP